MKNFVAALVLTCSMISTANLAFALEPYIGDDPPSMTTLERTINDYRKSLSGSLTPIQIIGLQKEYDGSYLIIMKRDPTERSPLAFKDGGTRLVRLESKEWVILDLTERGGPLVVQELSP